MANLALEKAHGEKVKEFAKFERDEQTTVAAILKTMDPGLTASSRHKMSLKPLIS